MRPGQSAGAEDEDDVEDVEDPAAELGLPMPPGGLSLPGVM